MALSQSALLGSWTRSGGRCGRPRSGESAATIYQALIEAELTSVIGAETHERTDTRTAQPNGHQADVVLDGRGLGAEDPQTADRLVWALPCWNDAAGSTKPCTRW